MKNLPINGLLALLICFSPLAAQTVPPVTVDAPLRPGADSTSEQPLPPQTNETSDTSSTEPERHPLHEDTERQQILTTPNAEQTRAEADKVFIENEHRRFNERPISLIDHPMSTKKKVALVSTAVAAGTLAAGFVFALKGNSAEQDLVNLVNFRDANLNPAAYDTVPRKKYDDLVDKGNRYNTTSYALFGVAAVATVTATTLFILDAMDEDHHEDGLRAGFSIDDDSFDLSLGWSF